MEEEEHTFKKSTQPFMALWQPPSPKSWSCAQSGCAVNKPISLVFLFCWLSSTTRKEKRKEKAGT